MNARLWKTGHKLDKQDIMAKRQERDHKGLKGLRILLAFVAISWRLRILKKQWRVN
jgi:hypothetical protein